MANVCNGGNANKQGGTIFHLRDWQILNKVVVYSIAQGIVRNGQLYPFGGSINCYYNLCRGKFYST